MTASTVTRALVGARWGILPRDKTQPFAQQEVCRVLPGTCPLRVIFGAAFR